MPIYAYRCSACGHAQDVLQKLSDPVLTTCPACGAEAYTKQVTAAGFQLKGSGWYVTDFRNGSNAAAKPGAEAAKPATDAAPAGDKPADKPAAATAVAPAAAPAAAPPPAPSP
jgi:putative FmdB family regulatory protein